MSKAAESHDETYAAFREAVNMAPGELEKWLDSEESRSVGWSDGAKKESAKGAESVGHHQGAGSSRSSTPRRPTSPTRTTPTCARWWGT